MTPVGRPSTPWLVVIAIGIGALVAIVAAPPDVRDTAARAAFVVAGIAASWLLLRRAAPATRSAPELFDLELTRPSPDRSELSGLRALDTAVRMAAANAFGVEVMLKPRLREIAGWRLMREHGVDIERTPETARRLLGEPLWRLTEPTPVRPDISAPGVPLAELRAAIADLERV